MKACGTCKFRKADRYDMPCLDCEFDEGGNPTRYEPQTITNADRIRAMTDEELAELLEGPYGNMLPHTALGWLKEEADDGN